MVVSYTTGPTVETWQAPPGKVIVAAHSAVGGSNNVGPNPYPNYTWPVGWNSTSLTFQPNLSGKVKVIFQVSDSVNPMPAGLTYKQAEGYVKTFIDRLSACRVSANAATPSSWNLQAPPADASEATRREYESYRLAIETELTNARESARSLCAGTGNGGVSDGGDPSPASDQPSGASGSFIIPGSSDVYGTSYEDIYAPQDRPGGATAIVPHPFAPPLPLPADPGATRLSRGGRAMAVGGVILFGGLLLVALRRRRTRR